MLDDTPTLETQDSPADIVPPLPPPGAVGAGMAGGDGDEPPRRGRKSFADEPKPESPFVWIALLLFIGVVMPFLPIGSIWVARFGALALAALYVFIVVRFASDATRVRLSVLQHVGLLAGVLALWWVFDTYVTPHASADLRALAMAARSAGTTPPEPPTSLLLQLFLARAIRDIFLLSAAVLGGALVSRLITEPNMLAPICGVIAVIDIWGVLFGGIVAQMLAKAPNVAARAMASPPTLGAARHIRPEFQIPLPDIGAGDYLFLGLLFAAMHAHRMNVRGAMKWITPLVIVALWGVTLGLPAMPGLLFIGLGAAIPNVRYFRFSRDEKFALLWAGAFVLVLAVGLGFAAPYIVAAAQSGEPNSGAIGATTK